MKFFLPYWEDWVHRDFDPITDTYSGGFENSLFAHEIFKPPPYDGILLSLGMFEFKLKLLKVNGRPTIRGYESVKEYLRIDSLGLPVMGDCGAFTYVNEKEPLLSVDEAVKTYSLLGFDYGISVDHICSDVILVEKGKEELFSYKSKKESRGKLKLELSESELEFRRQISLENGEEFLKKVKGFHPVGAAQGYSGDLHRQRWKADRHGLRLYSPWRACSKADRVYSGTPLNFKGKGTFKQSKVPPFGGFEEGAPSAHERPFNL